MDFSSIWSRGGHVSSIEGPVIGIDFGTSNSCVSVWRPDKKRVKIIKNKLKPIGKRTTPSTILFGESFDKWQVGLQIIDDAESSKGKILSNIKPCLGADAESVKNEIISASTHYDKVNDKLTIDCYDANNNKKAHSPEELASYILKYLKECAEEYLTRKPFKTIVDDSVDIRDFDSRTNAAKTTAKGADKGEDKDKATRKVVITKVVIGIPANYTERKKDAIRSAAHLAGFQEVHLMIESTAAAMGYGLLVAGRKNVLIVDIGGGTTDLTVMGIDNGVYSIEGTGGNVRLGGANMDIRLYGLVGKKISTAVSKVKASRGLYFDSKGLMTQLETHRNTLIQLCKQCKEELTTESTATITVPLNVCNPHLDSKLQPHPSSKDKPIEVEVSRVEFESAIHDIATLITATIIHTVQAWIDKEQAENWSSEVAATTTTNVTTDDTTTAAVADAVEGLQPKTETVSGVESDLVSPPAPSSFDLSSCLDEIVLVGGASRVPAVHTAIRSACESLGIYKFSADSALNGGVVFELCSAVNPDEAVAEGLAIRGAILSDADSTATLHNVLMMDCMAMSVGLMSWARSTDAGTGDGSDVRTDSCNGLNGRVFDVIIPKGVKIPAKGSKRFTLDSSQRNVRFVSLDMYERIDEQCLVSPTAAVTVTNPSDGESESGLTGGAGGAGGNAAGDGAAKSVTSRKNKAKGTNSKNINNVDSSTALASSMTTVTKYTYHLIATADVPIPPLAKDATPGAERQIEVVFRMDENGLLSYEVQDCCDNSGDGDGGVGIESASNGDSNAKSSGGAGSMTVGDALLKEQGSDQSTRTMAMLTVYIILMFITYVAVKLLMVEVEVKNGAMSAGAGAAAGGGAFDSVSAEDTVVMSGGGGEAIELVGAVVGMVGKVVNGVVGGGDVGAAEL